MRMKITLIISIVLITAAFVGCVFVNLSEFSAVAGRGDPESYIINVGGFNGITIRGFCEVHYYASESDNVILEVQPNLREYFIIEAVDGNLHVRTTRVISSASPVVLKVSTPELKRLTLDGAGIFMGIDKITTDSFSLRFSGAGKGTAELEVDSLTADLSGAGSFKFSGIADKAELALSGFGELNALGLQTRDAKVRLSGTGSIMVNCSDNLQINADGMGSVTYKGSPSLDLITSGMVGVRQVK